MQLVIDNVIKSNVKRGLISTERLDEELDTFIVIFTDRNAENYAPETRAQFFYNNEVAPLEFVVDNDDCVLINSQPPFFYRHTCSLIEPTKILEKYSVDNVAFTQPTDSENIRYTLADVFTRLRNITPLETYDRLESTRLFELGDDINALTNAAPQFRFSGMNLFQAFNETLKYVNAFSRVKSFTSLGLPILNKDDLNQRNETIVPNNIVSKSNNNNNDYYANKIDMFVENGTTENTVLYPPNPNLATLTTEATIMSTNDLMLQVPDRIRAVKKLILKIIYNNEYSSNEQAATITNFTFQTYDLTPFLYEKDLFGTLPLQESGKPSQYGSLYYVKGDNKIMNFGVAFPTLWGLFSSTTFQFIIDHVPSILVTMPNGKVRKFLPYQSGTTGSNALSGYYGFQIEYWPYVDARINVIKHNFNGNSNFAFFANQSGTALDMTRLGNNAQGIIDRVGNGDYSIEKDSTSFDKRFKVGQVYEDKIVTVSETRILAPNLFRCHAVLNKNYNRLSQYVGVDREFRQYEIPFADTTKRNMIYNEYCILSFDVSDNDNPVWSDQAIERFQKMFAWNYYKYDDYTIKGVIVSPSGISDEARAHTPSDKYFYKSLSKSAHNGATIFYFSFTSNTIAYYYPGKASSDNIFSQLLSTMNPIRYTYWNEDDETDIRNGTLEALWINFIAENPLADTATLLGAFLKAASTPNSAKGDYSYNYSGNGYPTVYYRLTSSNFVDELGNSWEYVKVRAKINSESPYELDDIVLIGVKEEDVLNDLLYKFTIAAQTETDYHQNEIQKFSSYYTEYPYIKNQGETNIYLWIAGLNQGTEGVLRNLYVLKDPLETLALTFQLNFRTDNDDIIVGPKLAMANPFYINRSKLAPNARELYLYRSVNEKYSASALTALGSRDYGAFAGFNDYNIADKKAFEILCEASLSGYASWGIGDFQGNLYFGINRSSDGSIYNNVNFLFRNKL